MDDADGLASPVAVAHGADDPAHAKLYPPPARVSDGAHVASLQAYRDEYAASIADPAGWWSRKATETLSWFRPFTPGAACGGSFEVGDVRWFSDGQLNACYNCVDRHVNAGRGNAPAIIWEGDEPGSGRTLTFSQLLAEVCRCAGVFALAGVKKGDTVALYMPMVPELAVAMLACARLGAVHSVVFGGFSSDALRDRILDGASAWVVTAQVGHRGGRAIPLRATTDAAVAQCACVRAVFVFRNGGPPVAARDAAPGAPHAVVDMEAALPGARPFCAAVAVDAEDPLFLLYTSGSTGKPKGLAHSTAGYLLMASLTHKIVFDVRPGDVYACVADAGWITGHSYVVYGPLANGASTLMFESTPLYPDASRYWDVVQRHRVTQFYTAPTAIRALMRFGAAPVDKHDLSSLRVLGSVGEPINPEAWRWYHAVVGKGRCAIVDTFWQTETGGIMITPLPGATPTKPGAASLPFFGVVPQLRDRAGAVVEGNDATGVLCMAAPWPGLARTIYKDHDRYLATYMRPFPGVYFTGDGAYRDKDGYYWITGRVDDVLNVSGHRIGSAEVESALVAHAKVAEAAVIGFPHDVKGEGICCYVTLKHGYAETADVATELKYQVRAVIGAFAAPDLVVLTSGLPKTRSGKIMRRILRKIAANQTDELGDISTLAEPAVVAELIAKVALARAAKI